MPTWICVTCGVEYPPSETPPAHCPICEDERQYVKAGGQAWTTRAEIAATRTLEWRDQEPGLAGIGGSPQVAIGQRTLFVAQPGGGVMWEGIPVLDKAVRDRIAASRGVRAMAMSHPHLHSAMVSVSEELGGVPIYLHEDDREWLMRPSPLVRLWSGETLDLGQGITLIRCGGHFEGSAVLHWRDGAGGKGVLMTGDTMQGAADTRWVSFMRSYPNMIPLPADKVRSIVSAVEPFAFDRLYGAWWDKIVAADAKGAVRRSAERYIRAIGG